VTEKEFKKRRQEAKKRWEKRNPERARATRQRAHLRWIKRNPEKLRAHQILNDALRSAERYKNTKIPKITKPKKCRVCRKEGLVEGHHSDYSKPLKVQWLCRNCHWKKHKKEKLNA
jgi:hypothetical protein